MKTLRPVRTCAILALVWLTASLSAQPPGKTDEEPSRVNETIEKSVDWYSVLPEEGAAVLKAVPVMRWRNVIRGQVGEAMMVIWPHNGRPIAMAGIYPWKGKMVHEFGSLSRESKLIARDKDRVIWSPATPGVEFKDVSKAPRPAKTAPERLRQMKAIAESFKATMTGWAGDNSDREELRLLPRPLYRYDLAGAKEPDPKLLDGALFAFVLGTDPEVVLALEAIGSPEDAVWQYACSRATSGGLEVRWGDDLVWSAPKHPGNNDPKRPHFAAQRIIDK